MKSLIKQLSESSNMDNRNDIFESFSEFRTILSELNEDSFEELTEAKTVDKLSDRQIKKLFRAASAITRGQSLKGASGGEALKQKMVDAIKGSYKKLSGANPVENFEQKAVDIINKWKGRLNPKDKVIDAARTLGRYGRDNPGKSAFVLGVLGTLSSALGTPAFGAAANVAINTAMELAKKN